MKATKKKYSDISFTSGLYDCKYFRSASKLREVLSSELNTDVFFSEAFFNALEEAPPADTHFRYVSIHRNEALVGVLYYQIKKINLRESLDGSFQNQKGIVTWIKKWITSFLNFYTLVNGNMFLTGNYGRWIPNIQNEISLIELEAINIKIVNQLRVEKFKVAAILLKDFYENAKWKDSDVLSEGYEEFSVQPNMILHIKSEWKTFQDYMGSLRSKYKVRTRRTLKKLEGVEKKVLSIDDLMEYRESMHNLYKYIALQAGFNLFILDHLYFYSLKAKLKEKIDIIGYFKGNRMIGFYTQIHNGDALDAHFLGYDFGLNRQHQLYHNMLYDLLKAGIETNKSHLILSRTAMEIKSSIGAEPKDMYLYLKIVNKFMNRYTKKVLPFLTPTVPWEERNPFK